MLRKITSKRRRGSDPTSILATGSPAPDFSLPDQTAQSISLRTYRSRPVVLVFYPADFSPVCGDQLVLYNEVLPLFEEYNAQVLAISVDGIWCHRAFSESRNLQFPLLSDSEPKGRLSRTYGVYNEEKGISQRALFVIDAQGIIRWSYVSPSGVNPGADGILNALESLKSTKGVSHGNS
jgi:peroxiredoxin (alkyl hydroperoxide reductase subunit C)